MSSGTAASCTVAAHPSLALVKYWGKQRGGVNLPATSSLAVTLGGLTSTTSCAAADRDSIVIDGEPQPGERSAAVLSAVRDYLRTHGHRAPPGFALRSENSFPTAAGLASSASGYAALVFAAVGLVSRELAEADAAALSALARVGSGSAARSVYGGFTAWEAGATTARQLHPPTWWPDLRVVILPVSQKAKPVSSRAGMNATRDTSPFYPAWVDDAPGLFREAAAALAARDLQRLGETMRMSYLRMFATMLGADPPIVYWQPATLAILHELETLRKAGVPAWETMDAGPQVKVLTMAPHAQDLARSLAPHCAQEPVISGVGAGARFLAC